MFVHIGVANQVFTRTMENVGLTMDVQGIRFRCGM